MFSIYDVFITSEVCIRTPSMSVVPIRVQIYFPGGKKGTVKMNEWKELLRPIWAQKDSTRTTVATQDLVFVTVRKSVP
jgi:hypothetical protein